MRSSQYANGIIYHIDLYRLKSIDEALNIGLEEYLYSENLCFIEWPDVAKNIIPPNIIVLKLEKRCGFSKYIQMKDSLHIMGFILLRV